MTQKYFKIDFAGIGAPKCATTWINECLQEHSQIQIAPKDQKQYAFFFKENPDEQELKEYGYFFKDNEEQLNGDFHANYLYHPEVIERMKTHNSDIKLIVCLRNPVERAYSEYRFFKYARDSEQPLTFKEMIEESPSIIERGRYYKYLKKYFDSFPRENILVLIFENINKNPLQFIQRGYQFLGVDDTFVPPSLDLKINLTQFKLTRLGKIFHKGIMKPLLNHTKWAWKLKRFPLMKKFAARLSETYAGKQKTEQMDDKTRNQLLDFYQNDIKNLEELTGKDLSKWKQ